ncbi:MAG: PLDc N-terminal domain-containing protein [Sulfitobacter sp.]|nr:PLDc N-terminal domain-containing protein [Sulfitobacter sp.]MDG1353304.1 PLDc N-terminal domain-containing protein [Sulfitobacter sp.]
MEYGILGLLILIADIYAIFQVFSSRVSGLAKILWTLVIVVFPVVGFIIWLIAGPRGATVRV